MVALILIFGFLAMVIGFFTLSEATMGVGILAAGCFLGIVARIAQAAQHQKELGTILAAMTKEVKPKPVSSEEQ
jgi:hypothetical protein